MNAADAGVLFTDCYSLGVNMHFFPPANFGYLLNPTNDILRATARTFHMAALTDSCKEIGRHSGKCQCQLCIASNYFNEEIIFPFSYPATAFSASQFKN